MLYHKTETRNLIRINTFSKRKKGRIRQSLTYSIHFNKVKISSKQYKRNIKRVKHELCKTSIQKCEYSNLNNIEKPSI